MNGLTRQDLKDAEENIKNHISDVIKPIIKDVSDHEIAINGLNKRSGLIGDMNIAFGSLRSITWFLALATVAVGILTYYKS